MRRPKIYPGSSLFYQAPIANGSTTDILHYIWGSVKPTFTSYIQAFAENIELLRKSNDDCQADVTLRNISRQDASPLGQELSNLPYSLSDSERKSMPHSQHDELICKETLSAAFLAISRSWLKDAYDAQQRIPNLYSTAFPSSPPQFDKFASIQTTNAILYARP